MKPGPDIRDVGSNNKFGHVQRLLVSWSGEKVLSSATRGLHTSLLKVAGNLRPVTCPLGEQGSQLLEVPSHLP